MDIREILAMFDQYNPSYSLEFQEKFWEQMKKLQKECFGDKQPVFQSSKLEGGFFENMVKNEWSDHDNNSSN